MGFVVSKQWEEKKAMEQVNRICFNLIFSSCDFASTWNLSTISSLNKTQIYTPFRANTSLFTGGVMVRFLHPTHATSHGPQAAHQPIQIPLKWFESLAAKLCIVINLATCLPVVEARFGDSLRKTEIHISSNE
jgi:hypothetical protein